MSCWSASSPTIAPGGRTPVTEPHRRTACLLSNMVETIMDTAFYAERAGRRADRAQDIRLDAVERENARLKLLLAEAILENALLNEGGASTDAMNDPRAPASAGN